MKTISLKMPDEVFEKVEKHRKAGKLNRSGYILEAVRAYNRQLERDALGQQLREEAKNDRELTKEIIEEWDVTTGDGLEDDEY